MVNAKRLGEDGSERKLSMRNIELLTGDDRD